MTKKTDTSYLPWINDPKIMQKSVKFTASVIFWIIFLLAVISLFMDYLSTLCLVHSTYIQGQDLIVWLANNELVRIRKEANVT
jgi:hypothetical protein